MATYEKFGNDNSNGGVPDQPPGDSTGNIECSDTQIEIQTADGSRFYPPNEGNKEMEFIADPAGDPFAPKSTVEALQAKVQRIIENFYFRVFTVLVILLDFILVIVDLAIYTCASNDKPLEIISHIIICYFVIEIGARIFYQGKLFFYNWLDLLDLIVVLVSFIVDVVFMVLSSKGCPSSGRYAQLVVVGRVVRIIRVVRIVYIMVVQHRQVARATRQMVSQNKRRYQKDGFDLDLCYITERVIAMSFPSKGMMAMYRNPVRVKIQALFHMFNLFHSICSSFG
ncbi:phosphatidylinositol-3,4,5-trisphosphate 3-phosphatase tpte2 [Plakobranchus ocellatus]|uniref:Phosphatidylinositol-3,4,5-trisphosphate 3-phosphatase tpte2 n=1 Tax=Plakobranchus ocellatus TaxID=259542 RepID=A0AAV3YGM7_9GAST|nr:phosphatidylinositol-3,4,5-trisphosphate 3-phosphatase tpte2 [Plakobranchus ocellatus]